MAEDDDEVLGRRSRLKRARFFFLQGGGRATADTTAPTITSANTGNCAENATLEHTLTANEGVTWSIVGGADQARFELNGDILRWAGNGTKDYETPNDADTNNTYVVQVRATDSSSNTTDQTITITVTDVSDAAAGDSLLLFNSQGVTLLHLGLI